jgi:hypothetical protein
MLSIFTGCSNDNFEVDDTGATKIRFNQSVQQLKKLDGEKVTISGYFSLLSPLNGTLVYMMNLPLQQCPFCIPNTNTLSNTIAVDFKKSPEFTSDPVKVVGKLITGKFTDDYGYEYDFKIVDAEYQKIDDKDIPEDFNVYYTLSADGYPFKLFDIVMLIDLYAYYPQYEIDVSELSTPIDFFDYEEVKQKVESYNDDDYDEFLEMWKKSKEIVDQINVFINDGTPEKCPTLQAEAMVLFERFNTWINKYEM